MAPPYRQLRIVIKTFPSTIHKMHSNCNDSNHVYISMYSCIVLYTIDNHVLSIMYSFSTEQIKYFSDFDAESALPSNHAGLVDVCIRNYKVIDEIVINSSKARFFDRELQDGSNLWLKPAIDA